MTWIAEKTFIFYQQVIFSYTVEMAMSPGKPLSVYAFVLVLLEDILFSYSNRVPGEQLWLIIKYFISIIEHFVIKKQSL
jgi:hypothetical protein